MRLPEWAPVAASKRGAVPVGPSSGSLGDAEVAAEDPLAVDTLKAAEGRAKTGAACVWPHGLPFM